MTDLKKKILEEVADKAIEELRLDITPERAEEIAIVYCDRNKYSLAEIQYMYDYIANKKIFKNLITMPSGSAVETMTKTEFIRWVELLNKRLKELN